MLGLRERRSLEMIAALARQIVDADWAASVTMAESTLIKAFNNTLSKRTPLPSAIVHFDQGGHYIGNNSNNPGTLEGGCDISQTRL